jgi:hypothetical protein
MFRFINLCCSKGKREPNFYLASNLNYLITKNDYHDDKTHQIQNQSQKNYSDSALTGLINLVHSNNLKQLNNNLAHWSIKKRDAYYKEV